jgi:hypothetical protein
LLSAVQAACLIALFRRSDCVCESEFSKGLPPPSGYNDVVFAILFLLSVVVTLGLAAYGGVSLHNFQVR